MSSFNFPNRSFPQTRLRRMRRDAFSRHLMRENTLSAHDLIYPVFVTEGEKLRTAIPSMPNQFRLSLDELLPVAERAATLGIPALALFPVIEAHKTGGSNWLLSLLGGSFGQWHGTSSVIYMLCSLLALGLVFRLVKLDWH